MVEIRRLSPEEAVKYDFTVESKAISDQSIISEKVETPTFSIPRDQRGRIRWSALNQDPETLYSWVESEARTFLAEYGTLTFNALITNGRSELSHALQRYYPEGLYGVQEKLGVTSRRKKKPTGFWQGPEAETKLKEEIQAIINEHGRLSANFLVEIGRSDLAGAIKFYPGQMPQLKRDLGLKPRTVKQGYWTQERMLEEARKFLSADGPITFELLRTQGRRDLAMAIQRRYVGGLAKLRAALGQTNPVKPRRYWKNPENMEREALEFCAQFGALNDTLLVQSGRRDLWSGIKRYYPGSIMALREKLGVPQHVVPEDQSVTTEEATQDLERLLEGQL